MRKKEKIEKRLRRYYKLMGYPEEKINELVKEEIGWYEVE